MSILRSNARNALGGDSPSMTDVDQAIFGTPGGSLDQLDTGRVVAKATPISSIWADVKQPRRAIPINIRLHWDGNPASVPQLLTDWLRVAEAEAGTSIDVGALLNGEGDGIDSDKFPSVAQEFMALARLAQGIKRDGLINPITVIESDGKLLIESGERRWLAYHLLNMYLGEAWAKIPAAKGNTNDSVWRQATENTQRRQLNPIGMGRQLALLIMAARGTPPMASGTQYQEYDEIVKNGASDRRFYAQVADGNIHRIPRGMGERIQAAMDLSMEQLSRYRALLRLTSDEMVNDALWTRADVENWPEGALREVSTLPIGKVSEVIQRDHWTIEDLRALKEVPVTLPPSVSNAMPIPKPMPIPEEWLGKHVRTVTGGISGKVEGVYKDNISIRHDHDKQRMTYKADQLVFMVPVKPAPDAIPAPQPAQHAGTNTDPFTHVFAIGDVVRTRTGTIGEIVGISGRHVTVKTINGTMVHDWSLLKKIEVPQPVTVIREEDIEADVDPEPTPHVREWSEGISIGENHLIDTDKASSQPTLLIPLNSPKHEAYTLLQRAFQLMGEHHMAELFRQHNETTDVQIREMGTMEERKLKLDDMYTQFGDGFSNFMQTHIASDLQVMELVE